MTQNFLDILININNLTTSNMLKKGINSYYISKLVSDKVIERVEKGKYTLKDFNMFYRYGKNLVKERLYDKGIKCFQKCIQMRPDYIPSYFQILIICLHQNDYNRFLEYLDVLSDKNFINDNGRRYLLFLLSNIIKLPNSYKEELSFLTFDDIKYINYNDRNMYNANKLQGLCFKKEFFEASFKSAKIVRSKFCSLFNIIEYLLICQCDNAVRKNTQTIKGLCLDGKFEEAKNIFGGEINPTKYNIYVVKLLDEIISLEKNNTPSKTSLLSASNVFEAIDGKNYSLALSLSKHDNILNDLLKIICTKIKSIINPMIEKTEQFSLNYFTEITKENFESIEKEIDYIFKLLKKKRGIYIMDCLNEKTTKDFLNIFSLYPNLKAFLINYNSEDRIVIKHNPKTMKEIDEKNNYLYASYLYEYKYYNECLEICLDLLEQDNPAMEVYLLLGYTYMKLKRPKDARNCFMVVYNNTKNVKYDDIISKINGVYSKPNFDMDIEEFMEIETNKLEKK